MTDNVQSILDTTTIHENLVFAKVMPRVVSEYGKSLGSQLKEIMQLCMRGNKLSTDEYYQMCMFDDKRLTMDEKRKFVGLQKSRNLWVNLNRINPWTGMIDDKLVFETVLAGFGLPTTNTQAIVGTNHRLPKPLAIKSEEELADFLETAEFPLFGKPLNARYSLGSAKFTGFNKDDAIVALHDGRSINLSDLWNEISSDFEAGYLFQTCLEQHSKLQELTKSGIATIRILTLDSGNGPEIYKAVIKLTGGGNVADNFWRKGNLLAPIDAETGKMGAARSGMGIDADIFENHPDSGKAISGTTLPYWPEITELCRSTAGLLNDAVMIGFDIALTESGPVIVEANYDPHLIMLQIAHGEGVLDAKMDQALTYVEHRVKKRDGDTREALKRERKQKAIDDKKALTMKSA